MNAQEEIALLAFIQETCAKHPGLVRKIIDAASEGVKEFADSQSDRAAKLSFKLFSVLDNAEANTLNFQPFSKEEVVCELNGCFGGTDGLKKLRAKFGIKE